MASLKTDKPAPGSQQPAGQVKKEPAGAPGAPAAKPAPKKAGNKPCDPKKKACSARATA